MGTAPCHGPTPVTPVKRKPERESLKQRIKDYENLKELNNLKDIEALNLITCLGYAELERLKRRYQESLETEDMFGELSLAAFYEIQVSEVSNRLYKSFNLVDSAGISFPHFVLVLDCIIGFAYPQLRFKFSQRFFGLDAEDSIISTKELKTIYDKCRPCAFNDFVFQPIEFKYEDCSHKKIDNQSLNLVLERRSDLWTFLLPDEFTRIDCME